MKTLPRPAQQRSSAPPRELIYFLLLPPAEQVNAIRRLAATGMSEHGIAAATRMSVEQIRKILAEVAK
jgi:hypothetical protein